MPHRPTSRARLRARRLGDVHETVDHLLQQLAARSGPADLTTWQRHRRRLERLIQLARRMLFELHDRELLAPIPAVLDPMCESFQLEFQAQLQAADRLARTSADWPTVVAELTDFLAWSFIGVENSIAER